MSVYMLIKYASIAIFVRAHRLPYVQIMIRYSHFILVCNVTRTQSIGKLRTPWSFLTNDWKFDDKLRQINEWLRVKMMTLIIKFGVIC